METHSKYQFLPFEHSGKEVRFHWDIQSYEVEDDPDLHWKAQEALCLDTDNSEEMLNKILAEGADEDTANYLVSLWNNK